MECKTELLSLPEELLTYILSFLPWRDLLRCTSLCRAVRHTYMSSSELQYVTELGSQQLLPVSNNRIPVSKRLQLLRKNTCAWSNFDLRSFETISIPEKFQKLTATYITNGHACFWNPSIIDSVRIFPILPKPLQQTIERDFSPGSLCSAPNHSNIDIFMDTAQNLLAVAYAISHDNYPLDEDSYIKLLTLDGDSVHPQAAGPILITSDLWVPRRRETPCSKLEGFGRHIAFLCFVPLFDGTESTIDSSFAFKWWLEIWDWQHSTSSNGILSGPIVLDLDDDRSTDFCFLGNDRFLIISDDLKLYSIEDMSQSPQLLVCFSLPASVLDLRCFTPTNDITCNSHPRIQAQWISDPKHRLLSLVSRSSSLVFVISTRVFFDDFIDSEEMILTIPWTCWGPLNSRIFLHYFPCRLGVSGNRALYVFPAAGTTNDGQLVSSGYRLHLMDFSLSAVRRHQPGLGRLVNEPSTVQNCQSGEYLTTFLPYVEVASDRTFSHGEFVDIWLDKDKIYLFRGNIDQQVTRTLNQLEVIRVNSV